MQQKLKNNLEIALALISALVLSAASSKPNNAPPSQEEYYSTSGKELSVQESAKADQLRVKTIRSIKTLLVEKQKSKRHRFEMQLRLGELYAERHDYLRDVEMRDYEKRYDAWLKNNKRGPEPKLESKMSQQELNNAANAFRTLVQEYPKDPRTDAALFALGKTLARMDNDNALIYFTQLIVHHKNSPLITDAYLAMGEFYFERNNFTKAIPSYKEVMKNKTHLAYPYAVYKLGWSYFNAPRKSDQELQANISRAVTSFKLVIKLADQQKDKAGRLNLREQAVNDLIMVWSETRDTTTAWQYFKTIGEDEAYYKLLEKLGQIYVEQGEHQNAIDIYTRLLKEAPLRPSSPQAYIQLLTLHHITNNTEAVVADLSTMHKQYLVSSPWLRKNGLNKELVAETRSAIKFQTHRLGTFYHKNGVKLKLKPMQVAAVTIYGLYLENFPKEANAHEIRFYLADLHLELKQYKNAVEQFTLVAFAQAKSGKYLQPAALNAVLAAREWDEAQTYPPLPAANQVPKPLPIPDVKATLLKSLDNYGQLLPKDKDTPTMSLAAAEIAYRFGHYDDALARYLRLTTSYAGSPQSITALKTMIAFHMAKSSWPKVIELAGGFRANKAFANRDLQQYLTEALKVATFNQALVYVEQKKFILAANGFLTFQKEFATDKNAERALANAADNFLKGGSPEDAIAAHTKLAQTYPNSSLRAEAMLDIAQIHEALMRFREAAKAYLDFAVTYPHDKRSGDAIFNSAILYKSTNQLALADQGMQMYLKKYGAKGELSQEASAESCAIKEKMQNIAAAATCYRTHSTTYASKNKDAYFYASAKASVLSGSQEVAKVKKQLISAKSVPAVAARKLIAGFLFSETESSLNSYMTLTVTDGSKLQAQVKSKQRRLEQLASRYQEVIAVGNAEFASAALYRLGDMHENFAQTLLTAPAPDKSAIEKVAYPLKEQAYQFYLAAFNTSQESEAFSDWTTLAYEKMSELTPDKHRRIIERSAEPEYMVQQVELESAVSGLASK